MYKMWKMKTERVIENKRWRRWHQVKKMKNQHEYEQEQEQERQQESGSMKDRDREIDKVNMRIENPTQD